MTQKEYDGFEELKFYIMKSIEEIKEELQIMRNNLREWRETTLLDIVEIKSKIKTTASISAFIISALISSVGIVLAIILR